MKELLSNDFLKKIESFITIDTDVLGGKPVFKGSRVPVYLVLDYLTKDWSIEDIGRKFPTVSKEAIISLEEVNKNI